MAEIAVAKEFFSAYLPVDLLKNINLDTLWLEKETFVDEVYKEVEADAMYSVKMGNNNAYLYLSIKQPKPHR